MTPTLTWKTHNGGKNHGKPQTAKCTMMRRLQTMGAQGQRPLVSPLPSPHAVVTTRRQLPLSLSHSLYSQLYTNSNNMLQHATMITIGTMIIVITIIATTITPTNGTQEITKGSRGHKTYTRNDGVHPTTIVEGHAPHGLTRHDLRSNKSDNW